MVRPQRDGPAQVFGPATLILARDREDQVQVTGGEARRLDQIPGVHDLFRRVPSAEGVERGVVETLHTHRDAGDADFLEGGELVGADG